MKTEERILMTARNLFSKKLYVEVSIVDIVFKAGVARSSFYNHFETKDECFVKTVLPVMKEAPDMFLRARYDTRMTAEGILLLYKEFYLKYTILFRNSIAFMYTTENQMLRDLLYTAYKNIYFSLKDCLGDNVSRNCPNIDKERLGEKVHNLMNAAIAEADILMLNTVMPVYGDITELAGLDKVL